MRWTPTKTQEAICLAKASGMNATQIAEIYDVSKSTVFRVCERLRKLNPDAAKFVSTADSEQYLAKLKHSLILDAHAAIDRSVRDSGNAHKAARTGLQYLKGVGEHGGEKGASDVNLQVLVSSTPEGFDAIKRLRREEAEALKTPVVEPEDGED